MKKFALVSFVALFFSASIVNAQTSTPVCNENVINRSISVSGEAEVRVIPDQVIISMTAENRGPSLIDVQKKNDEIVKNMVDYATKTLGVETKYVQTDYTKVEPVYRNCHYDDELAGRCNPLKIIYYTARKGIQIKLLDLTKYEGLINQALKFGVTNIDNIQFITTELRKHRDTARELAAKASQEKASAIAKTLGVEVGKPININATNYSSYYGSSSSRGGHNNMMQNTIQNAPSSSSSRGDGALALGQINVSAQINVTYELK